MQEWAMSISIVLKYEKNFSPLLYELLPNFNSIERGIPENVLKKLWISICVSTDVFIPYTSNSIFVDASSSRYYVNGVTSSFDSLPILLYSKLIIRIGPRK
jgi:hypothetical protein